MLVAAVAVAVELIVSPNVLNGGGGGTPPLKIRKVFLLLGVIFFQSLLPLLRVKLASALALTVL